MARAVFVVMMAMMCSDLIAGCTMAEQQREIGTLSREPTLHKDSETAPASNRSPGTVDFNRHVGWIHGGCLGIKNAEFQPGTIVHVIALETPQSVVKAAIIGKAISASECPALLSDRMKVNQSKGRSFYGLDPPHGTDFMAIGIVDLEARMTSVDGSTLINLKQNGKTAIAGFCQTSEGVRFYLAPRDSSEQGRLWSDNYYLGYDTKPTCRD